MRDNECGKKVGDSTGRDSWYSRVAKSNTRDMAHQIAFVRECVSIRLHVAVLLSEDVDVLVTFASIPAALVIAHSSGFGRRNHRAL